MHLKDQLHSPEFFVGDPYPTYRALRASDPICWNDVTKFWALLKYEDIRYVSSNPGKFSSANGITLPDPAIPSPGRRGQSHLHRSSSSPAAAETHQRRIHQASGQPAGGQDPRPGPRHSRRDRTGTDTRVRRRRRRSLPTRLIAEILGAPPSDWERFRVWSDACVGLDDPEIELDRVRRDRRTVRVLSAAHRRAARRRVRRRAVGPRPRGGRRRATRR